MEFKEFLKKKGVLTQFKNNCDKGDIERFLSGAHTNPLGCSFIWKNTPEGENFWRTLENERAEYLTKKDLDKDAERVYDTFIQFLKENNLTEHYFEEFYKSNSGRSLRGYKEILVNKGCSLVIEAFHWRFDERTSWSNVNKEWMKYNNI